MAHHKHSFLHYLISLFLVFGIAIAEAQEGPAGINRKAVCAGSFYPEGKRALMTALEDYFSKVSIRENDREVQAIVVPHAGYTNSGIVSAAGYSAISADRAYENIFILTTSHNISFNGASVYLPGDYETPLGTVEVNREIAGNLIEQNRIFEYVAEAHENEHGIEVQLPMIQYYFEKPGKIVPIILGTRSAQSSKDLALALLPYFRPENLFIISTNFSNYPSYADALTIDKITCDAILSNSPETFYNTLRKNSERNISNLVNSTYGWGPILTLLYMSSLNKEIIIDPLLYRNSGDIPGGNKERVIGYWAIASYLEPTVEEEGIISMAGKAQLLDISRSTLESFISSQELPDINSSAVEDQLKEPASLFVSLYMNGRLRGSVGQIEPSKPLYLTIQEMTAAAAVTDQRFAPVEVSELKYIKIEISILTPMTKIDDISDFEPGKHGIHIVKGEQSGTLLPQAGKGQNWGAEEFISHCSEHVAGIGRDGWKDADLYIFEVLVFSED